MRKWALFFFLGIQVAFSQEEPATYGISGNPGAVDIIVGMGELGRRLGIPEISGVRLGGVWLADSNALMSGGWRILISLIQTRSRRSCSF